MMNTDAGTFALNSVNTLINHTINKNQYKSQLEQLKGLISQFGFECEREIFRSLLVGITTTSTSDSQRLPLLQQLFTDLDVFARPNWTTLVTSGLKGVTQSVFDIAKCLQLSQPYRTALLIAVSEQTLLCEDSEGETTSESLGVTLEDIAQNWHSQSLNELTHAILTQTSRDNKLLFDKLRSGLKLSRDININPKVRLLHLPFCEETLTSSIRMEASLPSNAGNLSEDQIAAMLVNESGCQLTADMLRQFNVSPKLCAKILCVICENAALRQQDGQSQRSDEIDNFANICREVLSSASPLTEIIQAIDDEAFLINSKMLTNTKLINKSNISFQRFWQFCINLCTTDKQGIYVLGLTFFRKVWSHNVEFQFGFIIQCIRTQLIAKLLSGASGGGGEGSIEQLVPHLDLLKCQPDFETTPELNTWKFERLYQILIDISCVNYNNSMGTIFYNQVLDLIKWPLQQCPDLVTLGLLGCSSVPSVAKNEVLTLAIPAFLGNHPNAAIVLHTIWNASEVAPTSTVNANNWAKHILLQAMCDFYMKSPADEQQQRLSRILDVAQDLKALSLLLNGNCYPFVIDLACLASRREYLKLDKWLMDKIESNGENFVSACVAFLNRRCSTLLGGSNAIDSSNSTPFVNLPPETLATMLACLQQCLPPTPGANNNMSQELIETILTMVGNSTRFLSKMPNQRQAGVMQQPSPAAVSRQVSVNSNLGDLGLANLNLNTEHQVPSQSIPTSSTFSVPLRQQSFNANVVNSQPNQQQQGSLIPNLVQQPGQIQMSRNNFSGDFSNIFPEMQQNVSVDIEDEADSYFQRIYNQSAPNALSIDEVLEMLRRFQDSQVRRERDVFTCMIRNLFKEYGFFQQYPERELMITAQLFGGIIQMGLVKYMALVVALRYVLEALRKPPNSKMYYFGIHALKRFKTKLKDYPLYCQHLTGIPHFTSFPSDIIEFIEFGAQSQEPPNARTSGGGGGSSSGGVGMNQNSAIDSSAASGQSLPNLMSSSFGSSLPSIGNSNASSNAKAMTGILTSNMNVSNQAIGTPRPALTSVTNNSVAVTSTSTTRPSIANTTNIDTLLAAGDEMYQTPPDALQDKVAFIINNLAQVNLNQKAEEFKELIKDDQYIGWVAQYFVMKRASIEPNFHNLYASFMDKLNIPELNRLALQETHRNIKVLLGNDKEIVNFSDRCLLKNLGHWLGLMTLAKNKPILAVDIDLKNMLIEAYHKGIQELLNVVPFIAKILESCAKSKVFKPPNPWTMGLVRALVELHQERDLKLNLRFEVEVLCKNLNIDLQSEVRKSNVLKDEVRHSKIEFQLGSSGSGGINRVNTALAGSTSGGQMMPKMVTLIPQVDQQVISLPHAPHSPISHFNQLQSQQHVQMSNVSMTGSSSTSSTSSGPKPPRLFNYNELNTISMGGLAQHIVIQPNLNLINTNPILKQFVRPAIERAIQEWIAPVVDRSMKICLTTSEQIIKKDFALDPDENRMRLAAHYLTRNLTAGMAMITCREPLFISISTGLKTAFTNKCANATKELIEATAQEIANDNVDLACCFIQKTAIEKALPEIDKKLKSEYEARIKARAEGRRYCDPSVLTYQCERMPEPIRLKVGPVTSQQMNVYEELGKNIPGFVPPITEPTPTMPISSISNVISTGMSSNIGGQVPSLNQYKTPSSSGSGGLNVAGGMPLLPASFASTNDPVPVPPQAADAALVAIYEKLINELNALLLQLHNALQPAILLESIRSIAETLVLARQNPRDIVCALNLIQKVLEAIAELFLITSEPVQTLDMNLITRARDLYLVILKALSDPRAFTHQWTTKQITRLMLERLLTDSSINLPDELLEILIRSTLINFQLMDVHLAQLIEGAQSAAALQFTFQFCKYYGNHCNENDFPNTIDSLSRLGKNISSSNIQLFSEIQQIVEVLRGGQTQSQSNNAIHQGTSEAPIPTGMLGMHSSVGQGRDFDADPPGLLEKTERLLREWIQLYHSQSNTSKIFQFYVQQMNHQGILKTDDLITRFFRLSTEMCVELCYRILNSSGNSNIIEVRTKCFHTLDAFTHLIVMLVKHSGSNAATGAASETTAKLNLLNKVLGIIAGVATQDQDLRQQEFQHLPYYRIFVLLFMELVLGPANLGLPGSVLMQNQMAIGLNPNQLDPLLESVQHQVLAAFCNTLHILRPSKAPSFAFAWLDFISHRVFLEKCLHSGSGNAGGPTKGWAVYAQLLVDLIKFLAPFLRNVEMPASVDSLYKGTLKVFLVLLHDFPEFLCEYCYALCDVIPCNAIQMRNLVLSAFPRNMRLPDPFTPNLKIDSLPEITQAPKGNSILTNLANQSFKKDLDSYLRSRSPVTFLSDLRGYLQQTTPNQVSDSIHYNIPMINALVLYVGQFAIQAISPKNINMSSIAHSSHMDIFQNLAVALDTEGRYLFLNAIANQLRYPNSHTHYFSCTLLYLFAESNTEAIQEQITRVLLERLIVNRPHPWGLLVTFIELIKNPNFKFWNHEFVRCAPEIEKLFESVARSCNSTAYKGASVANNSGPPSEAGLITQAN